MAKSKNHTNHNQSKHSTLFNSTQPNSPPFVDAKFLRNQRFALKGTQKALAAAKSA
ncbi:hypothetical protein BCR43DRAFT_483999 [Syncephalastrum racemosum]|uniref:60S ribosomal protein L29 n=1 Tax=Syncephalastrum racemosum TaxID=13706 RepID=A0A1X2HWE5_SYNRA|nr:hypothetical protein BCR43DRAFT_483999 [Syncephalastrum racemosum]